MPSPYRTGGTGIGPGGGVGCGIGSGMGPGCGKGSGGTGRGGVDAIIWLLPCGVAAGLPISSCRQDASVDRESLERMAGLFG